MRHISAHDGLSIPVIGFGTYKLNGLAGAEAVADAIDGGYTLIDSAFNYENEGAVGEGVRRSHANRADVTVTSKLPGRHHAYAQARAAIEESVFRMGIGYIDLYLIHWPNPRVGKYVEAWRALIDAKTDGLVRHIGVCNFEPEYLKVLADETGVIPEVNQIELHPYFPQKDLVSFDDAHGIITEAWSPLRRGDLLSDPVIVDVAKKHGITPGQAVLAWDIARGVVPIPKAAHKERQAENLAAAQIALGSDDVARITALGRPDGRLANQDPRVYEEF